MPVQDISMVNFNQLIQQQAGVQIVRFWAPWCRPCLMMSPIDQQLATEFKQQAVFAEVNIDQQGELAALLNIRSIPTVVVFKDGVEVNRFSGLMQASILRPLLQVHL